MHDSQLLYTYATIWAIAFFASISRSFRDADYSSCLRLLGLGFSSGFFAIGIVGIVWPDLTGRDGRSICLAYLCGIAALVGLISKDQEKYVKLFYGMVMKVAAAIFTKDKK